MGQIACIQEGKGRIDRFRRLKTMGAAVGDAAYKTGGALVIRDVGGAVLKIGEKSFRTSGEKPVLTMESYGQRCMIAKDLKGLSVTSGHYWIRQGRTAHAKGQKGICNMQHVTNGL